jgi:hypothetical protein
MSDVTATISNVTGCLGMTPNGPNFTLDAVFNVRSPDGVIQHLV